MGVPFDSVIDAVKVGVSVRGDAEAPVRVAVFVDAGATRFLIDSVREALVPQTTAALVRVARLDDDPVTVKPDTDVAIVLSCGGDSLRERVQQVVVAGAPTVVLCEEEGQVPFIGEDTRMLGLIAASDKTYLLEALARWILDRTDKDTAFAANFPFMRVAAANRIIASASLGNMATGALFFIPGADFPVMTAAQLAMMLKLAAAFGKPLRLERGYEGAMVLACALALRGGTRVLTRRTGRYGFLLKALIGGAGTYAIGRMLCALYEHDVDYAPLNGAVLGAVGRARGLMPGAK